jgi:3-methyladenine DNA glycosylase/8-oxoguanine DNA glycosylase
VDAIALTWIMERILYPCAPFHFDGTFHKPSYFPSSDLAYEPGHFWQTVRFAGQIFGVRYDSLGDVENPAVRLTVFASTAPAEGVLDCLADELAFRYDLYSDLRSFYDIYRDDALLGPVLSRWRGMRPNTNTNLYEYLVIAVVLQNATVRRTVQMLENLFARYGSQVSFDGQTLSAFWPPEAICEATEEELRGLKLGYRGKTLKRQADTFLPGGLDEIALRGLSTPDLKAALLRLYGIGPASEWYLLFGVFKRYAVFEYVPPWEQKIFSRLLFNEEMVDAQRILDEAEVRWGHWKMLAVHILFEDLFWRRKHEPVAWLEELIRL